VRAWNGRKRTPHDVAYKEQEKAARRAATKFGKSGGGFFVQSLCDSGIKPVIEWGPINFWRLCLPSEPGRGAGAGNDCIRTLAFALCV
jgi:hypothetical protein